VHKIDDFINGGKTEEDQRRGKLNEKNSVSANYLTPFANGKEKRKKSRKGDDVSIVKVTDYLHLVDPILQRRSEFEEKTLHEDDRNEVQYLLKNKDQILDQEEKRLYIREWSHTKEETEA